MGASGGGMITNVPMSNLETRTMKKFLYNIHQNEDKIMYSKHMLLKCSSNWHVRCTTGHTVMTVQRSTV
jgi:hypothetical protein